MNQKVVNLIGNTCTDKGLKIQAMLDKNKYKIGKKVKNKEITNLSIKGDPFHPEWNYTIKPQAFIAIV